MEAITQLVLDENNTAFHPMMGIVTNSTLLAKIFYNYSETGSQSIKLLKLFLRSMMSLTMNSL